ncbi:MAG: hypothetical protein GY816_17350 [Cytophagales bacterium]|nr:hypothetical protein [Cytophagales bacterium]
MKFKDKAGHFTNLSKVIGMVSGTLIFLLAAGGAAFHIDDRHAHTIEVAGQFKAIDDSRQLDNLHNSLIQTQIRIDILEDRLWREKQKAAPSTEYINKLQNDLRKLNKQYDQINEQLLKQ